MAAIKQAEIEGKKAYGNYAILKFIIGSTTTLIGGIWTNEFGIGFWYAMMGLSQALVFIYAVFVIWEEKASSMLPTEGNLINNFKKFFKTIFGIDTLLPIILLVLIKLLPDITDAGTYILLGEMNWEPSDLALNAMICGIGYYFMMLYLVNRAKNLSFKYKALISCCANAVFAFTNFRFLFYQDFSYASMFTATMIATFFQYLSTDLLLIGIVNRFSVKCPKGLESFGIVSIAAITNFSATAGLMMGAKLMKYYDIRDKNYQNLGPPTLEVFIYSMFVLSATPLIGR